MSTEPTKTYRQRKPSAITTMLNRYEMAVKAYAQMGNQPSWKRKDIRQQYEKERNRVREYLTASFVES